MKLLFMGRKTSGAMALSWTLQNKSISVIGVLTDDQFPHSPCAKVANENNIPLFQLKDIYQLIESQEIEFDLAVSFVYWKKIRQPLISFPPFRIINFHPAPLPEYQGLGGYNMAIMDELDSWAVTAHYVDEEIDTGEIIDTFRFSINSSLETVVSLEKKSQEFMLELYKKTVNRVLQHGLLDSKKQDPLSGKYITRESLEMMKQVIPGEDVDKKIRAFWFPPYQGAYIDIQGKKYTLINEEILKTLAPPNETNWA